MYSSLVSLLGWAWSWDELIPLQKTIGTTDALAFSLEWQILGPFQIGTREATWGADPLEYFGGFRALEYNGTARYRSSLATNGTVTWSTQLADVSGGCPFNAQANLTVRFPDVEWSFLQSVYGWAALQWQAWARGSIGVTGANVKTIALYTDNVLEFYVDGIHYFGGDMYAIRRAPLVLHLAPGDHRIDIRVIRDVRAMGAVGEPDAEIRLEAAESQKGPSAQNNPGGLVVEERSLLMPDMVNRSLLASSLGSMTVRNEGRRWIKIQQIISTEFDLDLIRPFNKSLTLAPGQSRPLGFRIHVDRSHLHPLSLSFQLIYTFNDRSRTFLTEAIICPLDIASPGKPHKFTFPHPSGVVSYAMLRPPSQTVRDAEPSSSLPIIINLHGAGLEASSDQVRQMLDNAPNLRAWVLFPTGMSAWSGDDWHHWGFGDLEAAIAAIPQWISHVHWQGPFVDVGKWLVSGHSNGGQGAWFTLTHRPDKIIGAALVSSYSSIQAYVPYQFWVEVDPRLTALFHGSLSPYRHELLLENCKGIPIQLQHGSLDDNVPVFHSRRMNELVLQTDWDTRYAELAGKGHWFEGAMTTAPLVEFYDRVLAGNTSRPLVLDSFEFVIADPGDSDAQYGIKVDQLIAPGQLGRIKLRRRLSDDVLLFSTSNIHRFQILKEESFGQIPDQVLIDDQYFDLSFGVGSRGAWVLRLQDGSWKMSRNSGWARGERHGRQSGSLDAILRSRGSFVVVAPQPQVFNISLQIARNLHQYFGADVEIGGSDESLGRLEGNVIAVALGEKRFSSTNFPIRLVQGRGLVVRANHGAEKVYPFAGLGAIYIKPLEDERLELLIWGYDHAGLGQAARLLPMLTGVGQPDFIVVSRSCGWKGVAGVRAMGRFDMFWKVTSDSYLT